MIGKGTLTKVTVLIKDTGVEVTGLVAADIRCYVVKGNGVGSIYNLSGLISETDSVNAPGLYTVTLSAAILDIEGVISFTFYNVVASTFDSFSYTNEVGISPTSLNLMKKVILNNQVIDGTSGILNIYDDDGIAVVRSYYLQSDNSNPSIYNIRRKILV